MKKLWVMALAAVVSSATTAGAALPISNPSVYSQTGIVACTNATLPVKADLGAHTIRVQGIPAACAGLPLLLAVNGTVLPSVAATAPATTFNHTLTGTLTRAALLIDGWRVRTSIENTGEPIDPEPGYPDITTQVVYRQVSAGQFCADVTVTTTSVAPIPWMVRLNIAGPPFNNTQSGYQFTYGYGLTHPVPVDGQLHVAGQIASTQTVSASSSRVFYVCNYGPLNPPSIPGPESGITFSQSTVYPTQTGWYVCQTTTVTVTGSPTFFVGWETIIDLTQLRTWYIGTPPGRAVMQSGGFSLENVSGNTFRVKGTDVWNTAGIRDNTPRTFTECWTS